MKKKRLIRLVSILLSILMLTSTLSLSAFAAVEEKTYYEENFNEMTANAALTTGATLSAVPTYATVTERAAGDLAATVPFRGSVVDKSTLAGNPDKSVIAKNPAIAYTEGAYVLSIDYYLHYVDLAAEDCGYTYSGDRQDPTVECQFSSITYGADSTKVTFISLFILNVRTGALTHVGTPVSGAVGLTQDDWNTVKLIIDPVSGTYKTYVNGALYATDGYISRGNDNTGFTNINVPASSLIALKCNKNVGAYNANDTYDDITAVSVDNISLKKYTETVTVTVDGEEIDVIKDTVYTLSKEGYTLDYAVVTPAGGTPYVTTDAKFNAAVDAEIVCYWLEGEYHGYQSFDRLNTGEALSKADGFAAVPVFSTIMSETVGEDGTNGFVRVPYVGGESTSTTSNWDKSIQVNHAALNDGESFTLEASYRPHYNGTTTNKTPTVEAQLYSYSFVDKNGTAFNNGIYLNLYTIDLSTGIISGCGTVVENAQRLVQDQWNTVRLVFYPKTVSFKLYLNGELYSVQEDLACVYNNNGFITVHDCTDLTTNANQFIVAKCNKNTGAYVSSDNAANASYVDVDNVRVYATPKVTLTVDGAEKKVGDGQRYSLTESGETLLWADVTRPGEETVRIYEDSVIACDGMVVETVKIGIRSAGSELRMNAPDGVRFLTAFDRTLMDALLANEEVESVRVGTLIVPKLSLASLNALTHEALDAQGITYLEVMGTVGQWYRSDAQTYTLAGSIAYVKETNYNLALVGVGFVEATLKDGGVYSCYAVDMASVTDTTIAGEAKMMMEGSALSDAQKAQIKHFADAYVGDLLALYRKDLEGLNVLAFGDSLFGGTIGYEQSTQWVNKLGLDCGWNLSNLGIGSMTVSLTKYNNDSAHGNKDSMYDWMFNGKNDFRWGSTSTHTSPNRFFHCGNISGNPEDVELIILEGGCNDYGTAISAPLGTVDSHDPATFLGAWNLITERLLADYPNATIVFLTTWRLNPQSRENDTLTSIEFSESVITLYEEKYAENSRIALINAGDPAVSGVDMRDAAWRTEYSTDSYHLKDTGMAIMADNMLPLLWNIIREKRAGN